MHSMRSSNVKYIFYINILKAKVSERQEEEEERENSTGVRQSGGLVGSARHTHTHKGMYADNLSVDEVIRNLE